MGYVLCFIIGALCGVFTMALCVAASKNNQEYM